MSNIIAKIRKKIFKTMVLFFILMLCIFFVTACDIKIENNYKQDFSIEDLTNEDINELKSTILQISNNDNDDVKKRKETANLKKLKKVKVKYYNFEGKICDGVLIVNEVISEQIKSIFLKLYEKKYEIEEMNCYNVGKTNNSTYAFDIRSDKTSWHNYGLAIDINPLYNPYAEYKDDDRKNIIEVIPKGDVAEKYLNRKNKDNDEHKKHMIFECGFCYKLFREHDFIWGGNGWNTKKKIDYMHFEYNYEKNKEGFFIEDDDLIEKGNDVIFNSDLNSISETIYSPSINNVKPIISK